MTLGAGGHAEALLRVRRRRVIGVDRDPAAPVAWPRERLAPFGERVRVRARPASPRSTRSPPAAAVDGVLYDLGVSSMQLDQPERGFGYRVDGPLDMRMGADGPVRGRPRERALRGRARRPDLRVRRGASVPAGRARHRAATGRSPRPISSPAWSRARSGRRPGGPHPARRTFQALRIAVNRELEELAASLPQAVELLAPGGRVVVIAYHSLGGPHREVALPRATSGSLILTKKPQRPDRGRGRAQPPRAQRHAARRRADGGGGVSRPARQLPAPRDASSFTPTPSGRASRAHTRDAPHAPSTPPRGRRARRGSPPRLLALRRRSSCPVWSGRRGAERPAGADHLSACSRPQQVADLAGAAGAR